MIKRYFNANKSIYASVAPALCADQYLVTLHKRGRSGQYEKRDVLRVNDLRRAMAKGRALTENVTIN